MKWNFCAGTTFFEQQRQHLSSAKRHWQRLEQQLDLSDYSNKRKQNRFNKAGCGIVTHRRCDDAFAGPSRRAEAASAGDVAAEEKKEKKHLNVPVRSRSTGEKGKP